MQSIIYIFYILLFTFQNFPGSNLTHSKQTDLIYSYLISKTLKKNNSLQRLPREPSPPPMSPVNIQLAGEWLRPSSLIKTEERIKRKERKRRANLERIKRKEQENEFEVGWWVSLKEYYDIFSSSHLNRLLS